MIGYFDVFPEKAQTELRTATITGGRRCHDDIPDGQYLFTEYYCPDLTCDCQRLLVKVLRVTSADTRPEDVATISYTWNEQADSIWSKLTADMPNPFLDPLNRQAKYAEALLDFWREMTACDPVYVERLKRHYHELRGAVGHATRNSQHAFDDQPNAARRPRVMPTLTKRERRARQRRLQQYARD